MRYLIDFDVNERFQQSADLAAAEIVFYANLYCFFGSERFRQLADELSCTVRIFQRMELGRRHGRQ